MRKLAWFGLLVVAASCKPGGGKDGGGSEDMAMPPPADMAFAPTAEEIALIGDATSGMTAVRQTVQVADSLFNFDPTLSVDAGEQANLDAIRMETLKNLNGCGSVMLTLAGQDGGGSGTLTVDFGPPPGCMMKGVLVSGKVALTLAIVNKTITVSLLFTQLVAGSVSLDGALSFATSNNSTFNVKAVKFMTAGMTLDADVTVTGALLKATIDGSASLTAAGFTRTLGFSSIVVHPGGCYATSGTLTGSSPPFSATATFKATTPQDGVVDATFTGPLGTVKGPWTLRPYGSCPRQATDGGAGG